MNLREILFRLASVMLFLLTLSLPVQASSVREIIQTKIDQFSNTGQLDINGENLAVRDILIKFYQTRDYQPAWTGRERIKLLFDAINSAEKEGLDKGDYHCRLLDCENPDKGFREETSQEQAERDLLLTDALLRLVYHLEFGKVVPHKLDPDWNYDRNFLSEEPAEELQKILSSEDELRKLLTDVTNKGPFYADLKEALRHYRDIQAKGGWNTIPDGKVIKPGAIDERMPLIRQRLIASGDLPDTTPVSDVYSAALEEGVRQFQQRHGIEADAVIGNGTLAQMNVSVQQRIDQIRANLERVRWVYNGLDDEFIVVNIAGYQAYYIVEDNVVWQSRVQVGSSYRQTPVFKDSISYLVFNPTWTVPPTIFKKDVFPKLKKDHQDYLAAKNMEIVDAKGNIIKPDAIDWKATTVTNFPYMLRQKPGPDNALGQIKIMFPNQHLVYLHDTPYQAKFDKAQRAFSSGCVRVEKPFELAELLLKDKEQWNQKRFQKILADGETKNVKLKQTVPVMLLYFTVSRDSSGRVMFVEDVYGRDDKIIQGLSDPFEFVPPSKKTS